jgi:DNA mismatch repair protein MutL
MGRVIVLDEITANQIAAGEVVERPASVVKELVENALDAGAATVSLEIKNGGIASIRITDDGEGFYEDDVLLAFERYATSKLRSADDINKILTLGFRGEALPSVASVSRVRVTTRRRDAEFGKTVEIHGGQLVRDERVGCPAGTTIVVSELFYNVPARYKFLKKDAAEAAQISELVGRLAIGRPDVSFSLRSQNTQLLYTPGTGSLADAVFAVFGKEILDGLVPVSGGQPPYALSGYLGLPEIARGNRNLQLFYVNGRFIRNRVLHQAVEEAYQTHLLKKKHPVTILNITMDTGLLDVNAHPTKTEVRFVNEGELFRAVYHAITATLRGGGADVGGDAEAAGKSGMETAELSSVKAAGKSGTAELSGMERAAQPDAGDAGADVDAAARCGVRQDG